MTLPPNSQSTAFPAVAPRRLGAGLLAAGIAFLLTSAASAQTGFPFQDEALRYTINWPSGLSVGDAAFTAKHTTTGGWNLSAVLEGAFPGFPLKDTYRSTVTSNLCTLEFERDIIHGTRKSREKTVFEPERGKAKRGVGEEFDIPPCAQDGVAFLYHVRREMGQGRVPPAQQIYLGAAYGIRLDYTGARTITVTGKKEQTDLLNVSVKGPSSSFTFEIYFARDAARTPLLVRVPLGTLGTFSMELVR
jgi:hypothetical protein